MNQTGNSSDFMSFAGPFFINPYMSAFISRIRPEMDSVKMLQADKSLLYKARIVYEKIVTVYKIRLKCKVYSRLQLNSTDLS